MCIYMHMMHLCENPNRRDRVLSMPCLQLATVRRAVRCPRAMHMLLHVFLSSNLCVVCIQWVCAGGWPTLLHRRCCQQCACSTIRTRMGQPLWHGVAWPHSQPSHCRSGHRTAH